MTSAPADVFLSYSSNDEAAVAEIARRLLAQGVNPWLDSLRLVPGEAWQEELEDALENCSSCVIFVGPGGLGSWQREEMRTALDRRVAQNSASFRVIPVYLPGASPEAQALPSFLRRLTYVRFEGSVDDDGAFRRLMSGIQRSTLETPPGRETQKATCPYRGLQPFDVSDSYFFAGRDSLRIRLLDAIQPSRGLRQQTRMVSIVGPSGSGKSSVARAGLIADLRAGRLPESERWTIAVCRPGAEPLTSLALALLETRNATPNVHEVRDLVHDLAKDESTLHLFVRVALHSSPSSPRFVILIDQAEEIFALCSNSSHRDQFVRNLMYAASAIGGNTAVVITMRSDFYAKCAVYPDLAVAMSQRQVLVGSMSADELRAAIENPAELAALRLESGLADLLLDDAREEVGALPLLQHALLELWEKRNGSLMTIDAYKQIGRLPGALERRAEQVFSELSEDEQAVCKQILLRLVQPNGTSSATKLRIAVQELALSENDDELLEGILAHLTAPNARLLTAHVQPATGTPSVEISHEALLHSWKRLRTWLEEDRESVVLHHRLTESTREWLTSGCNEGFLYRGARLAHALEWEERNWAHLNRDERAFVNASRERVAEELRSSDSATLEQLETSARKVWAERAELEEWLRRAESLVSGLETHRHQLQRSRQAKSAGSAHLDTEEQFRRDTVARFIKRVERFDDGMLSAARHVARARVDATRQAPPTAALWDDVLEYLITSPEFENEGSSLFDTMAKEGLVPLGRDPLSGLWEFAHILSGTVPTRRMDGFLALNEKSGIVLVLLYGGRFKMGAVPPTADFPIGRPNCDPFALPEESPVHAVRLKPFLMGKYPITQGQWLRLSGYNPSMYCPEIGSSVSWAHPVECVDWFESMANLNRVNLTLPTEAQWEYAARAGSSSVWWSGDDRAAIEARAALTRPTHVPEGTDRSCNAFGLADVAGNVWEWCRDQYGEYTLPVSGGDAARSAESGLYVSRGGSFFNNADFARSAVRYFKTPPTARFNNRGLRASAALVNADRPPVEE